MARGGVSSTLDHSRHKIIVLVAAFGRAGWTGIIGGGVQVTLPFVASYCRSVGAQSAAQPWLTNPFTSPSPYKASKCKGSLQACQFPLINTVTMVSYLKIVRPVHVRINSSFS